MTQNTHAFGSSFSQMPDNVNSLERVTKSPVCIEEGKINLNPLERTFSPTQAYALSAQSNARRASSNGREDEREKRREYLSQKYS